MLTVSIGINLFIFNWKRQHRDKIVLNYIYEVLGMYIVHIKHVKCSIHLFIY